MILPTIVGIHCQPSLASIANHRWRPLPTIVGVHYQPPLVGTAIAIANIACVTLRVSSTCITPTEELEDDTASNTIK